VSIAISARNIQHRFGRADVLRSISMDVREGEFVALLGRNGSGKTTLLRILAGVLKPTKGEVEVNAAHAGVAYLAQNSLLPTDWTARELVELGRLPRRGFWRALQRDDFKAVCQAMESTGTLSLGKHRLSTLSGGEQQRVALARALAQEPQALLLDEPTNHLDLRHQMDTLSVLRAQASRGVAVIAVMHDLTLAALADRCVILSAGVVVASDSPSKVLRPELLQRVFGAQVEVLQTPNGRVVVAPSCAPTRERSLRALNHGQ